MLIHIPSLKKGISWRLIRKPTMVLVTNNCNLHCGGCAQHCDIFKKTNQVWNIPLEQLKFNIDVLTHPVCRFYSRRRSIGIFGGEPATHPKWKEILELLASYKNNHFIVFTNGTTKRRYPGNINYRRSPKHPNAVFVATLLAPIDFRHQKDKSWYWQQAKQYCYPWAKCWNIIYDNKAYFCEPAASLDRLLHLNAGWDIEIGKNPFMRTYAEVASQATQFCYRCGHCFGDRTQLVSRRTLISETNMDIFNPATES